MKLDFSKAHDTIAWEFKYQAMATIGVHSNFIEMTKLFFHEASIVVNINNQLSKSLDIQRGVRQGCPLAPNLVLIVGEVTIWSGKQRSIKRLEVVMFGIKLIAARRVHSFGPFGTKRLRLVLGGSCSLKTLTIHATCVWRISWKLSFIDFGIVELH